MSKNCYPAYIYVICPMNDVGEYCGVYVGRSVDPERRIEQHRYDYSGNKELHDLMLYNGYAYKVIDKIVSPDEDDKEYEWIDYFYIECERRKGWRIFNRIIGKKSCMELLRRCASGEWYGWEPKKAKEQ